MRENFPPLYVILDVALLGDSPVRMAETLAGAGVTLVQLRNKGVSARATFDMARQLAESPRMRGVRLIINDRPDIAALVAMGTRAELGREGGTHVGQNDIAPDEARILCPPPMWVGVSTHNLQQLREADGTTADYVAFGPIFHTTTKAKADPTVGLELLRQARQLTRKPLVAIGGITAENAAEVFAAGADCVAVARDIITAADAGGRAREFLKIAEKVQRN
jgi:thiamine-phosphate pyrophosphorylase